MFGLMVVFGLAGFIGLVGWVSRRDYVTRHSGTKASSASRRVRLLVAVSSFVFLIWSAVRDPRRSAFVFLVCLPVLGLEYAAFMANERSAKDPRDRHQPSGRAAIAAVAP